MSEEESGHATRGGTKSALILNSISLALIIVEAMMGPTILGNIIFLGLAIVLALIGAFVGIAAFVSSRTRSSLAVLLMSVALIGYVIFRFYLDTVPAGYGP
jgi:hypothetical protein